MGRHSQAPDKDDKSTDAEIDALDADARTAERSSTADQFWRRVRVEPVEIAMPKGVGLTLRAYRLSDEVEADEIDEESVEEPETEEPETRDEDGDDSDVEDDEDEDEESDDKDDDSDSKDDEDDEEEELVEEIPIFLSHKGRLPLFTTAEALVEFVKSDAPNALRSIDTWDELVKDIKPSYVVATEDDTYELDLVVKNLRGGHDTWEPELLVSAGELARDLGYALRLPTVMATLSEGSPLDSLDNTMRTIADGGLRATFAKRKVRKIGEQQTSLAWRGIVSKISEKVDWRK
ncbi:DNA primase [Stackebrandtia soli]|uniref:DNA primase n=1 Tax=Stackebrandtia soli TaxID=1892856 RepID=UPI0039E83CC4